MKKYYPFLIIVLCLLALSCGGSGGGNDDNDNNGDMTPVNSAPVINELEFRSDPFSETVPASLCRR